MGDSLRAMGRYSRALEAYQHAQQASVTQKILDTKRRLVIARRAAEYCQAESVLQVEPLGDGSHRWLVLFGRKSLTRDEEEKTPTFHGWYLVKRGIQLFQVSPNLEVKPLGNPCFGTGTEEDGYECLPGLQVIKLDQQGTLGVVLDRHEHGGSCNPNSQRVFTVDSDRLHQVAQFNGVFGPHILPATGSHGWRIVIDAVYKAYWPDVYEWRKGRFVFANQLNPGAYPAPVDAENDFKGDKRYSGPECLEAVSIDMIYGRHRSALRWLKIAEIACRRAIRDEEKYLWNPFIYGNPRIGLKQIRQRIRWIRNQDLYRALLYRPFDLKLQVPPFRLGNSDNLDQ